jgi:hypothetical protein
MDSHTHTHAETPAIACDVSGLAADLDGVEAIARMQLDARRAGCRVEFCGASPKLRALLAFCGLSGVLCLRGEAEHREQPVDVEKGVQADDPPA